MPAPNAAFQLVCQGVLPVVVAADRGGRSTGGWRCGRSATSRSSGVRRRRAPRTRRPARRCCPAPAVVPSIAVTSRPVPQQADAQVRVGPGRVQLERSLRAVLAGPLPGLGERAARSAPGCPARRDPGPACANAVRSTVVVALRRGTGTRRPGTQGRHLRGQHPVLLVAVRRRRRRRGRSPRPPAAAPAGPRGPGPPVPPATGPARTPPGRPGPPAGGPLPSLPGNQGRRRCWPAETTHTWQNGGTTKLLSGTVTRFSTSRPIRGFVAISAQRHPHAAARSSCDQVVTRR